MKINKISIVFLLCFLLLFNGCEFVGNMFSSAKDTLTDLIPFTEKKEDIIAEVKRLRAESKRCNQRIKDLEYKIIEAKKQKRANITWDDVSKKISLLEKEKENTLSIIKNRSK
ncbi:secreted protein [Candidatus Magnetomorum sp. HK-1]|nr:secreted protein [Candidatus Magnetomorum sp. HK-1]